MGDASTTGLNGGRFLLATALLGAGVAISQSATNSIEQAMICFAAGLVAIVAMADLSSPAKHNPQAAAPIRAPKSSRSASIAILPASSMAWPIRCWC